MVKQELVLNNSVGLHARPATFFIQKANEYKSSIWVEKKDRRVNAKSLLGVLSLGVAPGDTVLLSADGEDGGCGRCRTSRFGEQQFRRITGSVKTQVMRAGDESPALFEL